MSKFDSLYIDLCDRILKTGTRVKNRTGIDTIKIPFATMEFDLGKEFPILTSKYVAFKSAVLEMLWFYQVQSNDVRWLQERGVKIWNEWEMPDHTIGTAYGWIVNKFKLTQNLIETLKTNPTDRRMIMSLWQNEFLKTASLPSCVFCSQWDVTADKLNVIVTQRSCDVALGLPFNITQYAVLTNMLAQVTGLKVGKMLWVIKDAHIYVNQIDGINEQLRIFKEKGAPAAPKLWINPDIKDFFKFDNSKELNDIKLIDYQYNAKISMPVAK